MNEEGEVLLQKRAMSLEEIHNHEWTHSRLSKNSKNFISQFKISNIIEIEGKKIYIVHYPSNENVIYKKHIKMPTIKQNEEMFSEIDEIYLYMDIHIQQALIIKTINGI